MNQATRANVLLVDDREENLMALEAVLRSDDYHLVKATSGEDALRHLLADEFAAILLDVQMPGLDGFETAMLIKGRQRCQEVPILFITAVHLDELHSKKGYEIGGVDYIHKPFDPGSLRTKVAVFVSLYKKAQQNHRQEELEEQSKEFRKEQIKVELELRSQARFELLAEAIPQMVWTADADGNMEYFNHRWLAYTGLNAAQCNGLGWFRVVHPEDKEKTLALWKKPQSSNDIIEIEHRLLKKDGNYCWHLTRASVVRRDEQRVVKWFGTSTNIEEQKQTQEELKRSQEKLSQAVQLREDFLAIVSHDLKNPLGAIALSASIAKRLMPVPPIEGLAKQLDRIRSSADRADRLIHNLLELAQMEAGHMVVTKKPANLCAAVQEVVEMLEPLANEKGVRLKKEFLETECWIDCDRDRISQVLSNLVGNAIKFTPAGGEVSVNMRVKDAFVQTEVKDSGSGISDEMRSRLFDRYWQAKSTGLRDGTGLGLYIAKGIVETHGGTIGVQSILNEGSTFFFQLPRKESSKISRL